MKTIEFNKASDFADITGHSPTPASRAIPKWYKELLKFIDNKKVSDGRGNLPLTIKACPPFLDSMMSGYMIYTEFDLNVTLMDGEPRFDWAAGGDLISTHGKKQIASEQVADGYSDQPFKFNNLWQIVTPKGYSTLFTHPLNRPDLPFETISGIVETDTYKNIINFPFLIKKDFEGIIEAGTPIVQLTPFKREVWKMRKGTADPKEIADSVVRLRHKMFGGYKAQWWRRKSYQ